MKVGFQLSNSKRKKIVDEALPDDNEKKENLLLIEGNVLQTDLVRDQSTELVIPLPPPRNPTLFTNNHDHQKDLDEIAAQELLADLKGPTASESTLVIDSLKSKGNTSAPLLLANVPPELMNITNDDERFKADVSLRAENLDVNSNIYQSVPIDQFGAAMLRGMGWTGPSPDEEKDDKKYQVVPRESRLGLGATPKPPEEKKKSRDSKAKEKTETWKRKAEEHLEKQKLYVREKFYTNILTLVDRRCCSPASSYRIGCSKSNRCSNERCPWIGQNQVIISSNNLNWFPRVCLEKDGTEVIIDKKYLVLVTDDELKERPFKRILKLSGESDRGKIDQDSRDLEGRDERKHEKKSKSSKREREDEKEREKEFSKKRKDNSVDDESLQKKAASWLLNGIRVKIVSKKADGQGRYYLSKGTVVDVYYPSTKNRDSTSNKLASIRLDNGVVLQDVKEKYLETVLPKNIGDTCMILTGDHRGLSGTIMEKDFDRNEVTVQLLEEMEILLLSMDSVAELA